MAHPNNNNNFTLASDSDSEEIPPHKPTHSKTDPILPTHHKGRFPIAQSTPRRPSTNHFPSTRLQETPSSIDLTYPSRPPQVPAATYATTYPNHGTLPRTDPFPTIGVSREDFKHTAFHSSLRQGLELGKREVRIQVRGGRGDDLALPSRWGWRRWRVYYLILAFAVLTMFLVGSIILGVCVSDRKTAGRAGVMSAEGGGR